MRSFSARRIVGHESLCTRQPECARQPRKRGIIVAVAVTDQPDQIVRRLVAPTDLGEHHRLLNRFLIAQPPPVGLGQIGLRMRFGQVAAHLLMREHAIERFGETRCAA